MIIDALFGLVFGLLDLVIGLLPSWTPPTVDVAGVFATAGGYFAVLGRFIDIALAITVLEALLGAFGIAVTVRGVVWVYERIPFIG